MKESTSEHSKETYDLAGELLDAIIDENGNVSVSGHTLAGRLCSAMLKNAPSVKAADPSDPTEPDGFSYWLSKYKTSLQLTGKNGQTYTFAAFEGYEFGGSERRDMEVVTMLHHEENKVYHIYGSSSYMR